MCKYCRNCLSSERECMADQKYQNLKNFPFKKPPKQCVKSGLFSVNPELYTNYWNCYGNTLSLCNEICQFAYKGNKECDWTTCEALRYINGRTDIYLNEKRDLNYYDLLKQKKLTYRDKRGKKHLFKIAIKETCEKCNGEGFINSMKHPCPECNYRGKLIVGKKLP